MDGGRALRAGRSNMVLLLQETERSREVKEEIAGVQEDGERKIKRGSDESGKEERWGPLEEC